MSAKSGCSRLVAVAVLVIVTGRGAWAQAPPATTSPTPAPTAPSTPTPVPTPTLPPGFPPEPTNVQDCAQITATEHEGLLVVQPGSRVEVRGVQGCAPPVGRVVVLLDGRDVPIGEAVAVEDGSFVVVAQIPEDAERGPARIVVDVGRRQIVRAVHIGSPTVVVATPVPTVDAPTIAVLSLLAVGLITLLALAAGWLIRRRRSRVAPAVAADGPPLFDEIEPPPPPAPEPKPTRGRARRKREEPPAEAAFPWDEDEQEATDIPPWDEEPLKPPPRKRAPRKKPAPRKPRAPEPPPAAPEVEEPVVEPEEPAAEPVIEEPVVEEPTGEEPAVEPPQEGEVLPDLDELLAQPGDTPAPEPADRRRRRSKRRDRHVWPPLEEWD